MTGSVERKQAAFLDRIKDFAYIEAVHGSDETHVQMAMEAVCLLNDLLDAYESLDVIRTLFMPAWLSHGHEDNVAEQGLLALFKFSLMVNHDRYDEFLAEIHQHYAGKLTTNHIHEPGYAMSEADADCIPRQWDDQGNQLHNATAFIFLNSLAAQLQHNQFVAENGEAISKVIASLSVLEQCPGEKIADTILFKLIDLDVSVDDSRRQGILPFCSALIECQRRLLKGMKALDTNSSEDKLRASIKNFFSIAGTLCEEDQECIILEIHESLVALDCTLDVTLSSNNAVPAHAAFLQAAADYGFDLEAYVLPTSASDYSSVIATCEKCLASKPFDQYAGVDAGSVLSAAFLHLQDSDQLLAANLDADTLLALYLFKGDNRFKQALRTPDRADALLIHELGM
ncbi:hypothetical protein RBE51_20530 [Pseudomonas taiwanensis]|uniref:hypothetical protein n=1 Tax=Pseudomonas taiwanensis TaxID=470150 RepID=UPI0028DF45AC|nr:hypothetical protein [Pseudomonas taiwanensis]MDT8925182.1 hypothetical protein [Pseudomonas taiwanensis]